MVSCSINKLIILNCRIEKYRPEYLNDLISQNYIVETLEKFIQKGQMPHLLFYGPPGTGKTSTILALARQLYGNENLKSMVLELNASDDRGIDVVREQIRSFASTRNLFSNQNQKDQFKLVILDEADSMTGAAQAALRRVIEKYVKNTRFCLICNCVSGIIPAIQSRCTKFRFSPLKPELMKSRLLYICEKESARLAQPDLIAGTIIKISKGDMRRMLNLLQSIIVTCNSNSNQTSQITPDLIHTILGIPTPSEIERIFQWLTRESFDECFENIERICKNEGYSIGDLLNMLFDYLIDIKISDKARIIQSQRFASIEYALNKGCNEKIQLAALVACFQEIRKLEEIEEK